IMIGPTPFEIVGVAPQTFVGETVGFAPAVWVPLTMQAAVYRGDDFLSPPKDVKAKYMWLMIVARLRPDVSREQTTAGINVALQQLLQSEASSGMPEDRRRQYLDQRIQLADGSRGASALHGRFGDPLSIIMGLVGLLLLVACGNVANLLLARAASR